MKPLKVTFEKLNIETTSEYLEDFYGGEVDINEIKFNKKWQFSSYWFRYFKDKDSDIIKASCHLEGTDSIGELKEAVNYLMEISGYDDLFIIVKDRYDGEDEEYITFDAEFTSYPSPPGISWRGVEKEYGIMTDKENKKFQKIRDSLWWDCKYTEAYIERGKNYNPEKWAKLWIEEKLNRIWGSV